MSILTKVVLVIFLIQLIDFSYKHIEYLFYLICDKIMIFILLYEIELLMKKTDKLMKELEELEELEEEDGVIKWTIVK